MKGRPPFPPFLRLIRGGLVPVAFLLCRVAAADSADAILADIEQAMHAPAKTVPPICRLSPPQITTHHAHGPYALDYTRNLTFTDSRISYNLRYWMNVNTPDAAKAIAIEGTSGLGMDRPSAANWYSNNFFELTYGGKAILKKAIASFKLDKKQPRIAGATVTWNVPQALVVLHVSLAAGDDCLTLNLKVTAKGTPQPLSVGFRAYPGHYQPPRRRCVATVKREIHPPAKVTLGKDETKAVFFDELTPRTACAIDIGGVHSGRAVLDVGDYHVILQLEFSPAQSVETGPIRIWDFADTPAGAVMGELFGPPPATDTPQSTHR